MNVINATDSNNDANVDGHASQVKVFSCKKCDYHTCRQYDYSKHLLTDKHKNKYNKKTEIKHKVVNKISETCLCGKTYKHKSSFCKHKKVCGVCLKDSSISSVCDVIKQNNEFKELLVEQNKHILELIKEKSTAMITTNANNNNNNNNNTNNNCQQFNLQFFLNEQCKDAINIDDFVKTVVIQLQDLENSLTLGYCDNLSKVIVNALGAMDLYKRPIHCSDLKRETFYIKSGDLWEKENEDRKKIKKVITAVEGKTINKLAEWPKSHPNSLIGTHRDNTTYMKIARQVSGGDLSKEESNVNKIISNIAQKVTINKKK